ncbi:DUF1380 domain-containing protein [Escherichia coli]|nr:DUF1380 domain-containing protein [Escherichia coli]MBQ4760785.1 DUF1380 domain-containing protein [Escherichia coli]
MYCTVKEIIRDVLDTDVPDSECVFAVVLTRGDVRHIAQDWNLSDDELETVMQRLDDAFEYGADVSIVHDVVRELFARQGEVMNPLQYVPFNQTLYFINGDDPAQVAWMKRQTPPILESKIILVQGSIPEMQKSLDSRVYFDQNGVLCQRLGIDQVPARVSAVPGDRFLKVEFIPAEEGRK